MSRPTPQASDPRDYISAQRAGSPTELYANARLWLQEDWLRVTESLRGAEKRFTGKRILITGAAGFLGFNFLHFFSYLNDKNSGDRVSVVAVDNYLRGRPRWIVELAAADPHIEIEPLDITQLWPADQSGFDFIIHCASVASPTFYRRYPLETLDANVLGLRHMLDLAHRTGCESLLYFSSSEIYGDPPAHEIPTDENYRGNVACLGPRACYDESKRLGETLCYIYAQHHRVPVKIARPFNNYGPGLRLNDRRVLPDFCREILSERDVVLHSDGTPTRTFCYSSEAIAGYLLALLSAHNGEPFNIGADNPEISMQELAGVLLRMAQSNRRILHSASPDSEYLKDNPQRRCPDISKARALLGFEPKMNLEEGLTRMLSWYRQFESLQDSLDHKNPI